VELEAIEVKVKVLDLYRFANPATWARLIAYLRDERPDIVHAHGPSAFLYATLGCFWARGPAVIATYHSLYLQGKLESLPLKPWGAVKTRIFASLERWAARRAACLIFVSEADRQEYCGLGQSGLRAVTIPNGIDLGRFTPSQHPSLIRQRWGLDQEAKVVGCVSRLSPEKGLEYLLRAFPTILASYPDAFLVLVGEGAQRWELEELAQGLGLSHRVLFTGFTSEVPDLISAMDVLVLPSLWEGQPLSILEAWALGKPVVAAAVRGSRDLVEDGRTGILVPARNPQALASAVVALLGDPERARRLGIAGRQLVETQFSLERMRRSVGELYLRLYDQHGQGRSGTGC
jgi:glycosyltransferase involved in cell wall biosynthesis